MLASDAGKEMDALLVFATFLQQLKDHMLQNVENKFKGVLESQIKWVITVPAIWKDSSKQFMREATEKVNRPYMCWYYHTLAIKV